MSGCDLTDESVASRGKRWTDITFVRAVHYADAVVWDQKGRLIKHMLNLRWKKKRKRRRGQNKRDRMEWRKQKMSRGKQQRDGLNVIYCSSSRGALHLKGLINSLRGINKVSLIFPGAPGPSIMI